MNSLLRLEDMEIPALTELAQEQYEECLWAIEKALDKQLVFGRTMLIVKAKLPHGEWGAWVRETFSDQKSLRTIQRHMRGAEAIATDPSLLECADSLDGILKIVEERKPSVEVIEVAASVPAVIAVAAEIVEKPAKPVKATVASGKAKAAKPEATRYLYSIGECGYQYWVHSIYRQRAATKSGDLLTLSDLACGHTVRDESFFPKAPEKAHSNVSEIDWQESDEEAYETDMSGNKRTRELDLSRFEPREGGGKYLYFEPGRVCYYDETAMNAILKTQAIAHRREQERK